MLRVTTKQKATLSLCLNIIRTWTKSSAIEKPSILDTCWRAVRRSKPRVPHKLIETSAINKFWMRKFPAAASAQKGKLVQSADPPSPSGEVGTSDSEEDGSLASAKSLFFKNKGKQGKCTSTPKSGPENTPKNRKDGKKAARKKTKATAIADEPSVLSFMERAQERDEALMERMAEAERESRREQQKFSMDALKLLGNILKDVANAKK